MKKCYKVYSISQEAFLNGSYYRETEVKGEYAKVTLGDFQGFKKMSEIEMAGFKVINTKEV